MSHKVRETMSQKPNICELRYLTLICTVFAILITFVAIHPPCIIFIKRSNCNPILLHYALCHIRYVIFSQDRCLGYKSMQIHLLGHMFMNFIIIIIIHCLKSNIQEAQLCWVFSYKSVLSKSFMVISCVMF